MSETKFTPGPWQHRFFENGEWHLGEYDPETGQIEHTFLEGGMVLASDDTNKANAHLIAAAPEMYAALERAQLAVSNAIEMIGSQPKDPEYDTLRHIVSALAKARGEQP